MPSPLDSHSSTASLVDELQGGSCEEVGPVAEELQGCEEGNLVVKEPQVAG